MSAHTWAWICWAVAFAALLRLVWHFAWQRPRVAAAEQRHPAGRHRAPEEQQ